MKKTIYKCQLKADLFVDLPKGAQVLSVQEQRGKGICMWVLVEVPEFGDDLSDIVYERRRFRVFGTGQPLPSVGELKFIDTVQLSGGALVFHVFEEVLEG